MAVTRLSERVADVSKNHLAGHRAQVGARSLNLRDIRDARSLREQAAPLEERIESVRRMRERPRHGYWRAA